MIYVIRHGQTDWNIQKRVMGRHDEPLNETGLHQAEEAKNNLMNTKIDIIICSPLKRARQTAEVINEGRNIPIVYDDRITERDFGEFEGKQTKDFDFLSRLMPNYGAVNNFDILSEVVNFDDKSVIYTKLIDSYFNRNSVKNITSFIKEYASSVQSLDSSLSLSFRSSSVIFISYP